MNKLKIYPCKGLKGEIEIPGDKSISHRAVIMASLAAGKSTVKGLLESEDCLNTVQAFRSMGVNITRKEPGNYIIKGVGLRGLKEPEDIINCGNSGTSMRLLTGLLAAQNFYSVLTGDNSLRARPMGRVIEPLKMMGANIWARSGNLAPLSIKGGNLKGIDYVLPVASAQVKSSLLLAGLYVTDKVLIKEPSQSRDHTERMLRSFGIEVINNQGVIQLHNNKDNKLQAINLLIPGDISSAAFFMVAGLISQNSEIILRNVGINPTRNGIIEVIKRMEGQIDYLQEKTIGNEPVADILVKSSSLKSVEIKGDIIPRLIDELPIIALLASQAEGRTIIKDAEELRVKETDRIKATVIELKKLGVDIRELPDGMEINGPSTIKGGLEVESYGDHRIAMMLAIAGLIANDKIIINNSRSINTSFPEFVDLLDDLIQG